MWFLSLIQNFLIRFFFYMKVSRKFLWKQMLSKFWNKLLDITKLIIGDFGTKLGELENFYKN